MIRFRGADNPIAELFVVQLLQGFGSGVILIGTLVSAQIQVPHSQLAQITALILCCNFLGSSIGSSISGGIYTNTLKDELAKQLGPTADQTLIDSLYNSINPCDMDKDFLDHCSGGQSSKFNIHLEFNQVDDEKIAEAKEIIIDYSPFHAILHKMKISSRVDDFILPPVEKIKSEVKTKSSTGEKIGCSEAIYCQIKYKDGKIESGRLV